MWRRRATEAFFCLWAGALQAQECPPVNLEEQKTRERQCRTAGGEWGRFGAYAYLCRVYTCVERTRDAGQPCRNQSDCEHLCVTDAPPHIGAQAAGHCTALKTSFGCFTQVNGGRIVGRVCAE